MVELPYLAPYIDVLRTAMEFEIFEDLAGFTLYYMDAGIEKVDIKEAVTKGPDCLQKHELEGQMDFEQFGRMFRKAQSELRQKELVDIVRGLPENSTIHKILDIG